MSQQPHRVKVPDLGEGIAEVELVAWHVAIGDTVAEDQPIADVMTDKATVEIPSPVAGTVITLGGEVGQMLAVGASLIEIGLDEAGAPAPRTIEAPTPAPAPASNPATGPAPPAVAPIVAPAASAPQVNKATTTPVPKLQTPSTPQPRPQRPIASPAVRARAWELGIDLATVATTGTAGRTVQRDLDAHVASGGPRGTPVTGAATPRVVSASDSTQDIKIIGMRRVIALKMQTSKRSIPHYTYVEEVDVSELERLREHLNTRWAGSRVHLTLLAFLVRAVALAVRDFPQVNARFDDEAGVLTQHDAVHIGIATQAPVGLMVPVLRHAQANDLWANATEIVRLADAARRGVAVRSELTGSTITITSLGKLGGIVSTPVINHPEVAIVGVNKITDRPMVRGGAVVVRQMMNLSSSFDHRIVDGAAGAGFVQSLRGYLEQPATLFVE